MDRLTDAELVERLKLARDVGPTKAAAKVGVHLRNFQSSVAKAKARGLTAETKITDEAEALKARIKALQTEIAAIKRENDSADAIREEIYGLAAVNPDPPAWLSKIGKHRADETFSVPVALWSDWHWGEVVRAEEIGGVNAFNRKIAKERLRRLVETTIALAREHMGKLIYPGIVVCLGGDMISGNIHEELEITNDGPLQACIVELQDELCAALARIADVFGKVYVPCVVGNHGRTTMKPRAKRRAFESYEWNLYQQLERHFHADKRLRFMVANETDAYFSVLGHRFLLTHGDTLGVRGGDGIIGAIGPIMRGTMKVGRSEAQIGRDFDTLLMGHWHTYIPRGDSSPVIVNGTLKGYDEYARLFLRVPYTRPSQALWFVHARYGITAQWQVYLDDLKKSADSADWVRFEQRRVA